MMILKPLIQFLSVLILSPLLFGVVNVTKAFFAGRHGPSIFQLYYDLAKLSRKGAVISRTTTWIFWLGPLAGLSALFVGLMIFPVAGYPGFVSFEGDVIFLIYLLGLMRFFMVIAALDTGSSFEGMGASREVQFAVLAEPALFLSLAALARETGQVSLAGIFSHLIVDLWKTAGPVMALVAVALLIVFLAENSRIPVDDPQTHLELTMIHEVMVLDHGGVDLAGILYSAALKFWILGTLLVGTVWPFHSHIWGFDICLFILGMILLAVVVGIIESVMARLRMLKVPYLLITALSLAVLALTFQMRS